MNIFILTGAGVSAESGLGTFRDRNGLGADHCLLMLRREVRIGSSCSPTAPLATGASIR
jgi:NAD-dependent SIR2 family protein deacetylase